MRIKMFSLPVLSIVAAGLIISFYYASGRTAGERKVSGTGGAAEEVDQKVYSFKIDGKTSKDLQEWHLEGKTAQIFGDEIHLNSLVATAYGEKFTVNLTSKEGIYSKERSEVELMGDVRVVSQDGSVLTTDRAKWSQVTKDVTTEAPVNIKQDNLRASGIGGKANSDERKAELFKDVRVELEPSTLIVCSGPLEIDFGNNTAVFRNDVHVTDKDGELFSDILTVNFDASTKKIAEVIAENNVKLKRGNSYTICEKATYTDGTRSVQFVGKPRVVIDPNELEEMGGFSGKWPSTSAGE